MDDIYATRNRCSAEIARSDPPTMAYRAQPSIQVLEVRPYTTAARGLGQPGRHAHALRVHRARRSAPGVRRVRRGRHDCAADACVEHRALARLEGPDRVPGPALPGRHVRRAGQRPLRPAFGAAAYAEGEFAADTIAVMDATDTRDAVLVALSSGANWAVHVAADHPERVLGIFAMSPRASSTSTPRARRPPSPVGRTDRRDPRARRSTTSTTGSRVVTRTSWPSSSRRCTSSRTRPSRSRTASAGEWRPRRDPRRHHRRPARSGRRGVHAARGGLRTGSLSGDRRARDP